MTKLVPCLAALGALVLGGCHSNKLVFTTQTSLGLDISGTGEIPNKASLSYGRFEVAYVPRKSDNTAQSIYGGIDADVKFGLPPKYLVKQTFATGQAATNAVSQGFPAASQAASTSGAVVVSGKTNSTGFDPQPLTFFTATRFGIHVSVGEAQAPASLLMGYRRTEATVIPIPDPSIDVRPVFADIQINGSSSTTLTDSATNTPPRSILGGVRIVQRFATGQAAILASSNQDVRDRLDDAAGRRVAQFRTDYQAQELNSLKVIAAFCSGTLAARTNIFNKAVSLHVISTNTTLDRFPKVIRASPDAASATLGASLQTLAAYSDNPQ